MSTTNDLFAIAAHLHVVLRRKTGRVTDTEWMVNNAEYATAMVAYARAQAASDGHTELLPLADKLEALIPSMGAVARKPLLQAAAERLHSAQTAASTSPAPAQTAAPVPARRSGFADSVPASGFLESTLSSVFGSARKPEDDEPGGRYVGGIR
ncbi:hypothetical protein [Hydrogenophaga sp.]|uniref:hypothetical protein n=1 Tax=Hydrogenophaga sp. TaxID=1904254 RepID=UPI00271568E7|nr:hypothetical protein [Hydrogenophaga sp.]MDO8905026.1 hypothetical protein [Hydrogenophaga sp.]